MNIILFSIIVLLIALIVYSDIQNRKERERLQLKLMSRSVGEYVSSTEKVEDSPKEEEDPYIDMSEADINQILSAKEKP